MLLAASARAHPRGAGSSTVAPFYVLILEGDSTKFRERTGWLPLRFRTTLHDILTYWRERVLAAPTPW